MSWSRPSAHWKARGFVGVNRSDLHERYLMVQRLIDRLAMAYQL